jgi:hypothetical protein
VLRHAEDVVARATIQAVQACADSQDIVAIAADDHVVPAAALDHVVPGAAVEGVGEAAAGEAVVAQARRERRLLDAADDRAADRGVGSDLIDNRAGVRLKSSTALSTPVPPSTTRSSASAVRTSLPSSP